MLLAFSGDVGSGKDTCAEFARDYLNELTGEYHLLTKFAQGIYHVAWKWLGWCYDSEMYSRENKERPFKFYTEDYPKLEYLDMIIYELFSRWQDDIDYTFYNPKVNYENARKCANVILDNLFNDKTAKYEVNEENRVVRYYELTPRKILQIIGTEGFRETISQSFWTEIAVWDNAIFSDLRFENEQKHIKMYGGYTIHVVRPDNPMLAKSSHKSDNGELSPDYVLYNTGSLEELKERVQYRINAIWSLNEAQEV